MSKERIKARIIPPATREEMEQLVGGIAALKTGERSLTAAMDAEIKTIRDSYLADINEANEKVAALMPRALAWAEAHPDEFGKLRSIDMLHGVIGWRTNTPSLKTLAGWTWDRVLEKLESLKNLAQYVRTKKEVNKQAIIADRDGIGPEMLGVIGLRVVQEEEFYVEPKLTETTTREVAS